MHYAGFSQELCKTFARHYIGFSQKLCRVFARHYEGLTSYYVGFLTGIM